MSTPEDPIPPSQESWSPNPRPHYRKGISIPPEVRNHCHIYFDEALYRNAITLLSDLVLFGAAHPESADRPTFVPVPFHIELVSALLIHPLHTSHTRRAVPPDLPPRAIKLLRDILQILGPLNANLAEAFSFSLPRTFRQTRNDPDGSSSDSDTVDRHDRAKGIIANKGRIRRCAKDFWHMVGWSFNCSIKYPKRWKYWKVWLGYMLDVLDADWNERERLDEDSGNSDDFSLRRKSMLVTYLEETKERSGPLKRVVRSAFADASPDSLREFPEVFPNETKEENLKNGQKRKREHIADFDDSESEGTANSSALTNLTPEQHDEEEEEDIPAVDPWLGGPESMALRQRVLMLLSRVAAFVPDEFVDCIELYEILYFNIKPLPLPAFSLLISPSQSSKFPTVVLVSLSQLLLVNLLSNSAPRPQSTSGRTSDELTQDLLEQCFLPFAANTSSANDNAKVSILIESLFRLFVRLCGCLHTTSLGAAVEKGIAAREKKIKGDRRKKVNGTKWLEEKDDKAWLRASAERLRSLRDWVEENGDIA